MHIYGRNLLTGFFLSLVLSILCSTMALAADKEPITLEQAVQTVKQHFEVPAQYTEFTSGYNRSQDSSCWSLTWNDPANNSGNFSAQVDASTGEIVAMNSWRPDTPPYHRIPEISQAQAQEIGTGLLKRLLPARSSSLVLLPDTQPIFLSSNGPSTYTISWRRFADSIPVISDGATVEVNAHSGEVLRYNLTWTNQSLPAPTNIISSDAARQLFVDEEVLQLQYMLPYSMRPLSVQSQQAPLLVYRLDHPSNGVIDALTGELILPDSGQWLAGGGSDEMQNKSMQVAVPSVLTPQEEEEISQALDLISPEQAADVVNTWVEIPDNMVLRSVNLYQDWDEPSLRIWNLYWASASPTSSNLPLSIYGRVNARTGELLNFNLDLPTPTDPTEPISQEAARNLADNFMRRAQGERFAQFKLDERSLGRDNSSKMLPSYQTTWNFTYGRTVDGIPFPSNGAEIRIDRASQQIISYNLNWIDRDFPSSQGVLGIDRANTLYLQSAPLTLSYIALYSSEERAAKMRLVYQPLSPPSEPYCRIFDAKSGAKLNDRGQSVVPKIRPYVFNDIAGHFAEREIALLGQAGLMGEYGDTFRPDEPMHLAALLRAMLGSTNGVTTMQALSDAEVLEQAQALGWIKEKLAAELPVSRGLLAQLMVRSLNLEYLACLPDIYQVPTRDGASVLPDLKGYAALSWGLQIIKGDGEDFAVSHIVTRAEAAAALIRTLEVNI